MAIVNKIEKDSIQEVLLELKCNFWPDTNKSWLVD
jgi:hypothetical protein